MAPVALTLSPQPQDEKPQSAWSYEKKWISFKCKMLSKNNERVSSTNEIK